VGQEEAEGLCMAPSQGCSSYLAGVGQEEAEGLCMAPSPSVFNFLKAPSKKVK
jgi:hypothetical protein